MQRPGNVPANNVENSVAMDVHLTSITCPITNEIFFEPKMVVPCGHMFEYDSIKKWKESENTCPCCRAKIEKLIEAPPMLHEMLDNALTRYPQLQKQRYFSREILFRAVVAKNHVKLDKIIKFLTVVDDLINVADNEGDTVLWALTRNVAGVVALKKHDNFRAKINAASLNGATRRDATRGTTTLAWLVNYNSGRKILEKDHVFRGKITPFGLNNIIIGSDNRGTCALYWLLNYKSGLQMLCWDKELCAKVTEGGLNSIQMEKN